MVTQTFSFSTFLLFMYIKTLQEISKSYLINSVKPCSGYHKETTFQWFLRIPLNLFESFHLSCSLMLLCRLLSWGGKSIEPYGVDYILQKLGFSHARTTIPKWMQRGFMDPLDKASLVYLLQCIKL